MSTTDTGPRPDTSEPPPCGKCGAPLAPGQMFCGRCGAPVAAPPPAPDPAFPLQPEGAFANPEMKPASAPSSTRRTLMVLGGAAAVIVGLVAVVSGVREMTGSGEARRPAPYTGMAANGWPGQTSPGQTGQAPGQTPPDQGAPGPGLAFQAAPGQSGPEQAMPGQGGAYAQQGPQPGPMPQGGPDGAQPGPTGSMGAMGPGQGGPAMGPLQAPPPQGMNPLQSPVGAVFRSRMNGSAQASKLAEALSMGMASYFDGPPEVFHRTGDPQDRTAQWSFHATKGGQRLGGMILVQSDGQSGGVSYLIFDHEAQIRQSAGPMIALAQADLQASMRQ